VQSLHTIEGPAIREIHVGEVISTAWNMKGRLVTVIFLSVISAVLAAFILPDEYEASVLVAPSEDEFAGSRGGLNGIGGQYSGLAALAGFSAGGDTKKSESLAVLQSDSLIQSFIKSRNLIGVLFKDEMNNRTEPPTPWKASRFFRKKILTVVEDKKTGLITVTIVWTDPHQAAQWANELVALTNAWMRDRAIRDTERHISYLNQESEKTSIIPVKSAISAVLETEIKKAMLARGSDEYALKVLDPAEPPEKRARPNRLIWCAMGALIGISIAIGMALLSCIRPPRQSE